MNEEEIVLQTDQILSCKANHSTTEENAPQTNGDSLPKETLPARADGNDTCIFADTGTNSDSDCEGPDSTTPQSELDELRGELTQLRRELAEREARLMQAEQIERTYAEFCDLYPDISIDALPKEVWQDVKNGIPLAAAYALAERRKTIFDKRAADANAQNRARSAGAVNNAQNIEFSPAEVRAMSSSEVRANLPQIMRSMQKWH